MFLNTKHRSSRRSIGQRCSDIWTTIDRWIRTVAKFIYNTNRGEILGRTGQRWSKLAAFYLFFYLALSGFFLICLSIFMCFLPLNRPRFVAKASRLTSRSNPLTPGLAFRPQINVDLTELRTLITLSSSNNSSSSSNRYKQSLLQLSDKYKENIDEFLRTYYDSSSTEYFSISNVGNCSSAQEYGFHNGQPCILIKMNKIVDFIPESDKTSADNSNDSACHDSGSIQMRCMGENSFDEDNLGELVYYSESGSSNTCGSFKTRHFPYKGKVDRKNVYQAPYIWVQFRNLTVNALIAVECRVFGKNLHYDRMTHSASIRFQFYRFE